jgi:hypothetical protein
MRHGAASSLLADGATPAVESWLRQAWQEMATKRKQFVASAIGHPAEVANAWKTFRFPTN